MPELFIFHILKNKSKLGVVAHPVIPALQTEEGRSGVEGDSQLPREFKGSLGSASLNTQVTLLTARLYLLCYDFLFVLLKSGKLLEMSNEFFLIIPE